MRTQSIPTGIHSILASFRPCFTEPSFRSFSGLMIGWILCTGRKTIARVLQAAGLSKHHSTLYRFFSRACWRTDDLGQTVLQWLLPHLPQEVTVLVDDTLCHRSGPHFFGAGMHHDASRSTYGRFTSAGRTVQFAFGHNWVALAVWIPLSWHRSGGKALPILFRLYRSKKRCPASQYQKRTELAAEMIHLLAEWLPGDRRLLIVGDAEYACRGIVRHLPPRTHFVGPTCMDAALYAPVRRQKRWGRPRVKGHRLPSPRKLARRQSPRRWTRASVTIYGRETSIDVQSRICLWYTVGGEHPGRLVVTRDPRARIEDRAYFCTDPTRDIEEILVAFSRRWEIEVAFRDAKQSMGLEHPQNGWWRRQAGTRRPTKKAGPNPRGRRGEMAVLHTVPFVFLAYDLVILWYLRNGNPKRDVERARRAASWYLHKSSPSFVDMLAALRREIWIRRISPHPFQEGVRRKLRAVLKPWILAA